MKTLKWIGTRGNEIELRARCEITMANKKVDLDGYVYESKTKEEQVDAMLELWVDGKRLDHCWDINFWRLIDVDNGMKKIWGLNIAMTPEQAKEVEKFLNEVIENGKNVEVETAEKAEQENKKAAEVKEAKRILEEASKAEKIMTNAENRIWKENYNNVMNEGGEGYIPELVTKEQAEWAKKVLGQ